MALLALLVWPAMADTALPGLMQENLLLPIALPDGSRDIKASASNREGHCSSVISIARTIDDARETAMRQCVDEWKECSLYAV